MKSIKDTFETIRDIINALPVNVDIALIGGYAAVLHGIERTTLDVDVCLYPDSLRTSDIGDFFTVLQAYLPKRFRVELVRGSRNSDDPFKHDIIFLEDRRGEFMRIDLLIARYKWEREALSEAETIQGLPIPVLTKPYLVAMKLQATSLKDASDVVGLVNLMTEEERAKTMNLAVRAGRDKKLSRLLTPPEEEVGEVPEELL